MAGYPTVKKGNKLGEKAKHPRPGVPFIKDQVLPLITQCNGNLSKIADSIGGTRYSLRRFIDADPELKQLLEDTRERRIDLLEDSVWEDAVNFKDAAMRCFLLKTQARHRGYDQDDTKKIAQDLASAAFEFVVNRSKNPAEPSQ